MNLDRKRFRNAEWYLASGDKPGDVASVHEAILAVSMDLRDQLKLVNAHLKATHTTLRAISRKLAKPRKRRRRDNGAG